MSEGCLFCRIAKGEVKSEVVYENDFVFAFRDITPQAPSHILVIPKAHIARLTDISPGNSSVVSAIFEAIAELARAEGVDTDGYRVVANCNAAAGQTVFHIHFHLLGGRQLAWPPG